MVETVASGADRAGEFAELRRDETDFVAGGLPLDRAQFGLQRIEQGTSRPSNPSADEHRFRSHITPVQECISDMPDPVPSIAAIQPLAA